MRPTPNAPRLRARGRGAPAGQFGDRRGVTAVVVVLCLVPLAGMVALSVDLGQLFRTRRNAQVAADAAALGYAYERLRSEGSTAFAAQAVIAEASANGYTNGVNGATVSYDTVANWNGTGATVVRVTVSDVRPSLFAGILGRSQSTVVARASASWGLAVSSGCLMALNPTAQDALQAQGTPDITVNGCGVVVNSNNSTAAAATGGNGNISGSTIAVTGNVSGNGFSPTPTTGVPPSPDPLAGRVHVPTLPSSCTYSSNITVQNNNPQTFQPPTGSSVAVFCGSVTVKDVATFSPGIYVFLKGLSVTSQGTLSGTGGVTFVNTSGTIAGTTYGGGQIDITAGGTVNLTAGTSWPAAYSSLDGILFYQDMATPSAKIWANGGGTMNGSFYLPNALLDLGGGSSAVVNGGVIADRIQAGGNSGITINAPSSSTSQYYAARRVAMVE